MESLQLQSEIVDSNLYSRQQGRPIDVHHPTKLHLSTTTTVFTLYVRVYN